GSSEGLGAQRLRATPTGPAPSYHAHGPATAIRHRHSHPGAGPSGDATTGLGAVRPAAHVGHGHPGAGAPLRLAGEGRQHDSRRHPRRRLRARAPARHRRARRHRGRPARGGRHRQIPPTARAAGAAGGRQPRLPAHSLTRACAGPQDSRSRRRALPHLPVTSRAGGLAMLTEHRAVQDLLPSKAAAILLRGAPDVRTLAMDLAAATILTEVTVLWVEAANRFDLYAFAAAAKRWGDPPEALLKRLRIARAFTIYQLGEIGRASCREGG